jgi:hypothetical protein
VSIPDILRTLLVTAILAMAFLSFYCLSRRRLSWGQYLFYGLFAALVPVFGPFLVIVLRPGFPRRAAGPARSSPGLSPRATDSQGE